MNSKIIKISRTFLFLILCLLVLYSSCGQDEALSISEEKMQDILVDIHFADAMFLSQGYHDRKLKNDSLSHYNYIFKKHNINQQQFEDAIKYYAARPTKYSKIYDKIIESITKKADSLIMQGANKKAKNKADNDLWDQKTSWATPTDGDNQPIAYKIPINKHGRYTLSAEILFFPDDGTVSPRMSIFVYYKDGSYDIIEERTTKKDGEWRNYSVSIVTDKDREVDYLKGWVLDHSEGTKNKHSYVQNISLIYKDEDKPEMPVRLRKEDIKKRKKLRKER